MCVLIQVTRTQLWQQSVVWACYFHSDNLYGPWFVFISECEFDNTNTEWTPIEWRNVSGFHTNRAVKWCLNLLNHQFWSCGSPSSAGTPAIVYSYEALIKKSKRKSDKKYKESISHICFLIRSVVIKIIQFVPLVIPFFSKFIFLSAKQIASWWYIEIYYNPVITNSVYMKTRLKC